MRPEPDEGPLLTDLEGPDLRRGADVGAGRAIVITAELPAHPRLYTALLELARLPSRASGSGRPSPAWW